MRWLIPVAVGVLLLTACGGSDDSPAPQASDATQEQVASQPQPQSQQTEPQPAESQVAPDAQDAQDAQSVTQPQGASEAPAFDPDSVDMSALIYWGPLDGFFGMYLPIPRSEQQLIDQLLGSDSPAIDKYVIDLAAFPNPYRRQVMAYLLSRYGSSRQTIYDYPQIWEFDPTDSATLGYLEFKQALFGGHFKAMSEMMDPDSDLAIDAREVMWGGVNVDGIPPLELPAQLLPEDAAEWINDSDVVVGVEINGDARAYPIRIIAWHEMVNDTIGGVPVSLAYCTLCGSPILFDGRVGSEVYRFGTSGLLYRSNKLMYDRNTMTLWNQFTGRPAWGPLVGQDIRLKVLPAVVTTWGDWHSRHPDTTVLSIETGFVRDYGPGVAYNDYFNSSLTWFNVPVQDDRLFAKDRVFVVRIGEALTAYPVRQLARSVLVRDKVGGLEIVVLTTADGEGGRSYESTGVQFVDADPMAGTLTDSDGNTWEIREDGLLGPDGSVLARVGGHNAYWFAITNQTDNGQLWEG